MLLNYEIIWYVSFDSFLQSKIISIFESLNAWNVTALSPELGGLNIRSFPKKFKLFVLLGFPPKFKKLGWTGAGAVFKTGFVPNGALVGNAEGNALVLKLRLDGNAFVGWVWGKGWLYKLNISILWGAVFGAAPPGAAPPVTGTFKRSLSKLNAPEF